MRHLVLLSIGAIGLCGLAGCGDVDVLQATFSDELVEAQARAVQLKVVDDADCSTLSRVEHAQIESVANVLVVRRTTYPINPESGILKDLPRGRALVFDVSVQDQESRQIARACEGVTLPDKGTTEVVIAMETLLPCEIPPVALDVAVVFDASQAMSLADATLGSEVSTRLLPFFETPLSPAGDRWTLIVHGPTAQPEVRVPFTSDPNEIASAIEQIANGFSGPSRLYDATRLATIVLRSRAVCGRRPALLLIAGGIDAGPRGGRELAIAGLAGDRQNPDDDLFGVGVGVSVAGKEALDLILVEGLGRSQGALTAQTLTSVMRTARERLQALIGL